MKTKPFNLADAMNGAKLVTREGMEAKFIAYGPESRDWSRVVVLIDGRVVTLDIFGRGHSERDTCNDLFLAVQTRSINGYEYPEPERVEPEKGTECWAASPSSEDFVLRFWFAHRDNRHRQLLKRGRVHLSKENAKQHAIAEILAGGGEV